MGASELFANSPIDNPARDVRASRKREEVTVGLNITGRLQRPELRLFSEPAMEESDALAYLVLGHPLRSASSSEATSVSAAATSLGLVGGERIAQAIGGEFGVDEVSVGSEYSQNAALLLGKYLSPRLYLQYATPISLTRRTSGVALRNSHGVTVVARDAMTADALATALSVTPVDQGMSVVESVDGASAAVVTRGDKGAEWKVSPGFPPLLRRREPLQSAVPGHAVHD